MSIFDWDLHPYPHPDSRWHGRFFRLAMEVSTWSKDPQRKVGAVLVSIDRRSVSYGYNGFPRGVDDKPERLADDGLRLMMTVHAEMNAILNSPFSPIGTSLYVTQPPCHECGKAIVQSGISQVFAPEPRALSKWTTSWVAADALFAEAGVGRYHYTVE